MIDLLKSQKLDMYIDTFRENGIDGDILSAILTRKESDGKEMADHILQEDLGMKDKLDRWKIKSKGKKYVATL